MEYKYLLMDKEDPFVTIVLNRPEKLNALSYDMFAEIGNAISEINKMTEIRAVIIKGSGRAFSAGTDLGGLGEGGNRRTTSGYRYHLYDLQENLSRIERLEKPVIAQIHGYALGGAMELILACDFRIAVSDTRFSLPEVPIGIVPDLGGCQRLVRIIGLPKAKEMIMMGRAINGVEAERIGLINKAVQADELETEVRKWAEEFTKLPPLAVGMAKRIVDKSLDTDLMSSFDSNWQLQSILTKTEDFKEGVRAKKEKRDPVFKGE